MAAIVALAKIYKKANDESASATGGASEANIKDSNISLDTKVIEQTRYAEEKQHRKHEKEYWDRSLRFTVAAVVIAIAAAIAAGGAFVQAQRQAAAAEEANRPWLRVAGLHISSTLTKEDVLTIFYSIEMQNSGHDTATRIFADVTQPISLEENAAHYRDRAKILCEKSALPVDDYLGAVAFPSASSYFPSSKKIHIPMSKDLREYYSARFEGCLLYEDSQHKPHRTSFSYTLAGINLSRPLEPIGSWNPATNPNEPTYAD